MENLDLEVHPLSSLLRRHMWLAAPATVLSSLLEALSVPSRSPIFGHMALGAPLAEILFLLKPRGVLTLLPFPRSHGHDEKDIIPFFRSQECLELLPESYSQESLGAIPC